MSFYLTYLANWPEYFLVKEAPTGQLMAYSECPSLAVVVVPARFKYDDRLPACTVARDMRCAADCTASVSSAAAACTRRALHRRHRRRCLSRIAAAAAAAACAPVMGKAEGEGPLWHGHVTAVTVAPRYRRLGLARQLMDALEGVATYAHNAYFVDLFVRVSNALAIAMYRSFGYEVHRQVRRRPPLHRCVAVGAAQCGAAGCCDLSSLCCDHAVTPLPLLCCPAAAVAMFVSYGILSAQQPARGAPPHFCSAHSVPSAVACSTHPEAAAALTRCRVHPCCCCARRSRWRRR
jgi:ribosomal protein S18 acetylase RimI-like enzyme